MQIKLYALLPLIAPRPVLFQKALQSAHFVAEGKLQVEETKVSAGGEIGQLNGAINRMNGSLQSLIMKAARLPRIRLGLLVMVGRQPLFRRR